MHERREVVLWGFVLALVVGLVFAVQPLPDGLVVVVAIFSSVLAEAIVKVLRER